MRAFFLYPALLLTLAEQSPSQEFPELELRLEKDCCLHIDKKTKRVLCVSFSNGPGDIRKANPSQYPHLTMIDVEYYSELNQDDIDTLSSLKQLKELKLGQAAGLAECATINADLAALGQLKNLEWLELSKKEMKDEDLAFVAKLPKLKWIVVEATETLTESDRPPITDKCAEYLVAARSLETIDIVGRTEVTDKFVSQIAGLPKLEVLELDSDRLTDKSLGLLALRAKQLRVLRIGSKQFTGKGVRFLGRLTNLETLWLRSPTLKGDCLVGLKRLKQLRHLSISVSSIDSMAMKAIAGLPKLESLPLEQLPITMEQFELFMDHPSLRFISIDGSQLDPEQAMAVIRSLRKLERIKVSGNEVLRMLTEELRTRKAFPNRK